MFIEHFHLKYKIGPIIICFQETTSILYHYEHETLTQFGFNIGPPSLTVAQY